MEQSFWQKYGVWGVVSILISLVLVLAVIPATLFIGDAGAISKLEGSGYTVLAAGSYSALDALIDAIKAKTDNLPSDPADQSLLTDNLNAIMEELEAFEEHFHNEELWFGISADQSGEDWGEQDTLTPFVATSGNNAWGTAGTDPAKVAGLLDSGAGEGDFHRILVVANTSATVYKGRIIWGTGTVAQGVAANQYTEFMFIRDAVASQRKIFDIMMPRLPAGNRVWLEIWNATNDATLTFFVGAHVYS